MNVELAWDVIKILIGVVLGGGSGYLILARDVAFVKGQLMHMSRVFEAVENNQRHLGRIEAASNKQREDLNGYYQRLRKVEAAIFAEDEEDPPISQM